MKKTIITDTTSVLPEFRVLSSYNGMANYEDKLYEVEQFINNKIGKYNKELKNLDSDDMIDDEDRLDKDIERSLKNTVDIFLSSVFTGKYSFIKYKVLKVNKPRAYNYMNDKVSLEFTFDDVKMGLLAETMNIEYDDPDLLAEETIKAIINKNGRESNENLLMEIFIDDCPIYGSIYDYLKDEIKESIVDASINYYRLKKFNNEYEPSQKEIDTLCGKWIEEIDTI
jgi:hypothetical protein